MVTQPYNRRQFLARSIQAAALTGCTLPCAPLLAGQSSRRFKIGACDWSLGKRNDPTAFDLARQIGLDGLQIDMGTIENEMLLRRRDVQRQYLEASKRTGVEIASLAEAAFWQAPLKTDARAAKWLSDSIDVCTALGMKLTMPACFELDMSDAPGIDHAAKVIQEAAKKAEKQGVTIGLENWMSADDHRRMIERIGSPAVKVYYDVGNSTDRGRDVLKEIRALGPLICEFHFKDANHLLGHGRIDFKAVRRAIDDIGYSGWIHLEAAAPHGVLADYTTQCQFLRGLFPADV